MEQRRLGGQGLEVSALGLGCMGMTWAYWGRGCRGGRGDAARGGRRRRHAVRHGRGLRAVHQRANARSAAQGRAPRPGVLATKFGFRIERLTARSGLDSRPDHIREVVEASLERLRTDRIDLLYQHRVDPAVPIEDVVGAMAGLVRGRQGPLPGAVRGERRDRPAGARRAPDQRRCRSEYSLWERGSRSRSCPPAGSWDRPGALLARLAEAS